MKKVEFDYEQGRFLVETDEQGGEVFIEKYSKAFIDILATYKFPMKEATQQPPVEDTSPMIPLFGITEAQLAKIVSFTGGTKDGTVNFSVLDRYILGDQKEKAKKMVLLYCGAVLNYKNRNGSGLKIWNLLVDWGYCYNGVATDLLKTGLFSYSERSFTDSTISLTMKGKDALVDLCREIVAAMENEK